MGLWSYKLTAMTSSVTENFDESVFSDPLSVDVVAGDFESVLSV
jgi:hypothetical protein